MDRLLLLLLLWSLGLTTEGKRTSREQVRLVRGDSRCAGTLEVKHQGNWRPVTFIPAEWSMKAAAAVCEELDCGSAVSVQQKPSDTSAWLIRSSCVQSGFSLSECAISGHSYQILDLTCLDSVRLVNGTSLCSGRLEVKSDQSNQRWSSVCEADFDQQDAAVVCRELGCGPPFLLQGALYGEMETPVWTKEIQCGGHESALLNCRSSSSARNTCSPGKAVRLTCSEPVRLVGGDSRCAGTLMLKHQGDWRPVDHSARLHDWTLKNAAVACRDLDCGTAVSVGRRKSSHRSIWSIWPACFQFGSALRECVKPASSSSVVDLKCSDSVRLVNGTSLCSGRLEVKSDQSNQWWSSVCETDFDQQDADVVCRELGCGPPLLHQGALYGEVESPVWTKEFHCAGHESALLDCTSSDSAQNTCSPGKAVGLTCSEPVRLVGGDTRCEGILEVKHQGDWRPVGDSDWTPEAADVACRDVNCGSFVSVGLKYVPSRPLVSWIMSECVESGSALRDCGTSLFYYYILNLTCSDLLLPQPIISLSSSMDGASKAQQQGSLVFSGSTFTISCSIQPQYQGGSFQLTFTSPNTARNYTQAAVSHSAHFRFPAAEPAHQGNYSCVYHVHAISHNFFSESHVLSLTVQSDPTVTIIRLILLSTLLNAALYICCKASRGPKPSTQETIELDNYNPGVPAAGGGPAEEGRAQGAE